MSLLNAKKRNALPDSDFAGPNRTYPINDREHAVKAMQLGRPGASLRASIDAKAEKKFPGVGGSMISKRKK